MIAIREGKRYEFVANPTIEADFPECLPTTNEVSTRRIKEMVSHFDKLESRAACEALVQNYPGMYFDVFIKEYTGKAAKLEAIKKVIE